MSEEEKTQNTPKEENTQNTPEEESQNTPEEESQNVHEEEKSTSIFDDEDNIDESEEEEAKGGGCRTVISIVVLILISIFAVYRIRSCQKVMSEGESGMARKQPKVSQPSKRVSSGGAADYKNPVVRDLPKTPVPLVQLLDDKPSRDKLKTLTPFPKLRSYNGDDWDQEKTDIFMAVHGTKLYALCILHDSNPDEIVTEFSEKGGGHNAYKDDSIELFLMPSEDPESYSQHVCSASGEYQSYYNGINSDNPTAKTAGEKPDNVQDPLIEVERLDKGFLVYMEIDLREIGLEKVESRDALSLQVVRNYRGQGNSDSHTLHLFPTHIYGDTKLGLNNHDRRAFQPVKISKGTSK